MQAFTEKSMDFQTKIIERSGLGDETYLPVGKPSEMLPPTPLSACRIKACAAGLEMSFSDPVVLLLSSCGNARGVSGGASYQMEEWLPCHQWGLMQSLGPRKARLHSLLQ